MKTYLQILVTLTLIVGIQRANAESTAFNYQGRLLNNGAPAAGNYDLRFNLYDDGTNGNLIASVTNSAAAVTNGLFSATLDFGDVFTGTNYWLEIAARTNGASSFTALTPRQQILSVPYATFAGSADAAVALSGTVSGSGLNGTYSNSVSLNNVGNNFVGNGSGITSVNAVLLNGLASSNFWQTTGNAGTSPDNGNFLGTTDNQPLELWVNNQRAFRLEPTATNGSVNVIGGSAANVIVPGAVGSVIAGGGRLDNDGNFETNSVAGNYSFIGGGSGNAINTGADYSAIVSGENNFLDLDSHHSAIMAGEQNTIGEDTDHSFIGSGVNNSIFLSGGTANFIAGGENNSISGDSIDDAVIGGGNGNTVAGNAATVAGGANNTANYDNSTVAGGTENSAQGYFATASGGQNNSAANDNATIGGGLNNTASGFASTVAGGGDSQTVHDIKNKPLPHGGDNVAGNLASGNYSSIGGGRGNTVSGLASTIAGGEGNTATIDDSVIGGGQGNNVNGNSGTVAGGVNNSANGNNTTTGGGNGNDAEGDNSTISGGNGNSAWGAADAIGGGGGNSSAGGNVSTIAGGENNNSFGSDAAIGGGSGNQVGDSFTTVSGGINNIATNMSSSVSGGTNNASGGYASIVDGGSDNSALGDYSLAAGWNAQATNSGAFVWADASGFPFTSTTNNEFSARATGGVRFVTAVDDSGNPTAGVSLAAGDTSWSVISDRNVKKDFAPVNSQDVLDKLAAVPVEQWHYKWQSSDSTPNIGPMAQDFIHAFYPGRNDKSISTLEFDGVELAAIKGLNDEIKQRDEKIQELENRLNQLETAVKSLNANK